MELNGRTKIGFCICFVLGLVLFAGCDAPRLDRCDEACAMISNTSLRFQQAMEHPCFNRCGCLRNDDTSINVTGFFETRAKSGTSLYLFIAPDRSRNATAFVIQNCTPIAQKDVTDLRDFDLGPLPKGNYVVLVIGTSLTGPQPTPIIREKNDSGLLVRSHAQGIGIGYSTLSFSVDQTPAAGHGYRKNVNRGQS